jgi:hypothetical protein
MSIILILLIVIFAIIFIYKGVDDYNYLLEKSDDTYERDMYDYFCNITGNN